MFAAHRSLTPGTSEHLEKSIHFLTLRILSEYDDEFVEQRWASMMVLGSIYVNLKVAAVHVTCREFTSVRSLR